MDFEEMLELARTGGEAMPENIFDDLATTYQSTVAGAQHSLSQRDAELAEARQENLTLKARAFESMLSNQGAPDDADEDDTDNTDIPQQGIASLFTRRTVR